MSTEDNILNRKPYCVVIDTNIWRAELLLQTPRGRSLVYMLGRQGGYLGLPEIVEKEIPKQIVRLGEEIEQKCENYLRRLAILVDDPTLTVLPRMREFENITQKRLAELEPIITRIPFTFEHAKNALQLVYDDLPPNSSGNQQFKDSAIWQAVLELSYQHTVHFVTNDRAFLADSKDYRKGLARNLDENCRKIKTEVHIYSDLKSCLDVIGRELDNVDKNTIFSLIYKEIEPTITNRTYQLKCEIGEIRDRKVLAYPSNDTEKIVIEFSISIQIERNPHITETDIDQGKLFVVGNCFYMRSSAQIAGLTLDVMEFRIGHCSGYTVTHSYSIDKNNINPFPKPMDSIYQEIDSLEI